MEFIKRVRWAYLLLSLFLIGIGVILFMMPEISMNLVVMIVGGGAMLFGLLKIIVYFVRQVASMVEQYDFSVGVLSIAMGAILLVQPSELLRLLPQVVALCMVIDCVFKMQVALDAKRLGSGAWFLQLFMVLICTVWGVFLLLQPFGLDAYVSQMMAGALVADGVLNFVAVLFIAFTVKKELPKEDPKPNIPDPMKSAEKPAAAVPVPALPEEVKPVEEEESEVQVRDLIEESRALSNQPQGKGSVFSFFKK